MRKSTSASRALRARGRCGPETAKAPAGWRDRLIRVEVQARTKSPRRPIAWCLEPHDLVLAKCVAGRERDWEFARDALGAGIVDITVLLSRVDGLPIDERHREHVRQMFESLDRC